MFKSKLVRASALIGAGFLGVAALLYTVAQVTLVGPRQGPLYIGGLLYASNFGQFNVPPGNIGQYSWKKGATCQPTLGGVTFNAFTVNVPVRIYDLDDPTLSETVTPTSVGITTETCTITIAPIHGHTNYHFSSASGGLYEAIQWALGTSASYVVEVTPDFTLLGGTTSTITSAAGSTNVTISDHRTAVIASYTWNGSAYVVSATPGGNVSGQVSGFIPLASGPTALTGPSHLADSGGFIISTEDFVLPLTSNLATGLMVPTAYAVRQTYQVTAYGAKPDAAFKSATGTYAIAMTSGGTTATFSGGGIALTPADVGKWVSVILPTAQPFPTVAYAEQANYTTNNVAQIVTVTDPTHAVLSKTASNSFTGSMWYGTDASPGFNACAQAAYSSYIWLNSVGGGVCIVPAGQYLFATSSFYVLSGAFDDGGTGNTTGGSGGSVTCSVSGGKLSACPVTGGSKYTANSTLQAVISGGCTGVGACGNGLITVNTDASGVPVSPATIVHSGFGFVSSPTATITPLSGDGAAATATISAGAIDTTNVTAPGSGHVASSTVNWYAMVGTSGCANINPGTGQSPFAAKGTAPTDANGQVINPLTIVTNATGCTSPPVIVFGDYPFNSGTLGSPVWVQATNIAPLEQYAQPVYVFVPHTVSFVGQTTSRGGGVSLVGSWDGKTVDKNQPAILGSQGLVNSDLISFQLANAQFGILGAGLSDYCKVKDVFFSTGIGLMVQTSDIGCVYENLTFQTPIASWINGGWWTQRPDFTNEGGGYMDTATINPSIISRPLPYGGPGSLSQKFDDFFDQFYWLSSASGNSTDFLETCKFPAAISQRQTGHSMADVNHNANTHCYPGISSLGLGLFSRGGRGSNQIILPNLIAKNISRNAICCTVGAMQGTGISVEGGAPISGTNDPYRNAPQLEGAIKTVEGLISLPGALPFFSGVSYTGGTPAWIIFSINSQGNPTTIGWNQLQTSGVTNVQLAATNFFSNISTHRGGIAVGPVLVSAANTCNIGSGSTAGVCLYGTNSNTPTLGGGMAYSTGLGGVPGAKLVGQDGTTAVLEFRSNGFKVSPIVNGVLGFQYNSAAPSGHSLCGNGTAYVDSATLCTGSTPAAFAAVTITSHAGTLATAGAAFTNGTVVLDHTSTTTINVSGLTNGSYFNLRLTQDSSGGNTLTMGTGCTWLVGSGSGFVASTTPTLTAGASGINVLSAVYDGTNCLYNIR